MNSLNALVDLSKLRELSAQSRWVRFQAWLACIGLSWGAIWAAIEPLDLPSMIGFAGVIAHRGLIQAVASVVIGTGTLLVLQRRQRLAKAPWFSDKAAILEQELTLLERNAPTMTPDELSCGIDKAATNLFCLATRLSEPAPREVKANLMEYRSSERQLVIIKTHGEYHPNAHMRRFKIKGGLSEGSCGKAFSQGKVIAIDDARHDHRASHRLPTSEEKLVAILSIPLGKLGVLNLDSNRPGYFKRISLERIERLQKLGVRLLALRSSGPGTLPGTLEPPQKVASQRSGRPKPTVRGRRSRPRSSRAGGATAVEPQGTRGWKARVRHSY